MLPHRVDNYESSMRDSYGYNRSVVTQYFVIANWSYQQKVVKFIQEIQWLKVQTSAEFNKIIAKNASNDKNEIILSKNEFVEVNNWFTGAGKAYNNMQPLINKISYDGYSDNDLSLELNDDIDIKKLSELIQNITKFDEYLCRFFSQNEGSILTFKHFDIGSNDIVISIIAGTLSGVIAEGIVIGIKWLIKKLKKWWTKKYSEKQLKDDEKNSERFKVINKFARDKGLTEDKIDSEIMTNIDNKQTDEIFEHLNSLRKSAKLNTNVMKQEDGNGDKKLIKKLYNTYEEIISKCKISFVRNYSLSNIDKTQILDFDKYESIEDKNLEKKYENAIEEMNKIKLKPLPDKNNKSEK